MNCRNTRICVLLLLSSLSENVVTSFVGVNVGVGRPAPSASYQVKDDGSQTFVSALSNDEMQDFSASTTNLSFSTTTSSRKSFVKSSALILGGGLMGLIGTDGSNNAAWATGRATLEQAYRRYAPRIRAGGEFYQNDLKQLISKADWQGIQEALREVPDRKKSDLTKPDAGVAQRARMAGGFSDARVLVAADLFASSFSSQNSITPKTKAMKEAVAKLRTVVSEMEDVTKQALGEGGGGGFFGMGGKKKVNETELLQQMRSLYAQGGNAWNEYIYAANDELALQFDKFDYIK